jgi:hypothetical protein
MPSTTLFKQLLTMNLSFIEHQGETPMPITYLIQHRIHYLQNTSFFWKDGLIPRPKRIQQRAARPRCGRMWCPSRSTVAVLLTSYFLPLPSSLPSLIPHPSSLLSCGGFVGFFSDEQTNGRGNLPHKHSNSVQKHHQTRTFGQNSYNSAGTHPAHYPAACPSFLEQRHDHYWEH